MLASPRAICLCQSSSIRSVTFSMRTALSEEGRQKLLCRTRQLVKILDYKNGKFRGFLSAARRLWATLSNWSTQCLNKNRTYTSQSLFRFMSAASKCEQWMFHFFDRYFKTVRNITRRHGLRHAQNLKRCVSTASF